MYINIYSTKYRELSWWLLRWSSLEAPELSLWQSTMPPMMTLVLWEILASLHVMSDWIFMNNITAVRQKKIIEYNSATDVFRYKRIVIQWVHCEIFIAWTPLLTAPNILLLLMTSSNVNIFHVTGHLCGEFNGHRWIPRSKASDADVWCFPWSAPGWMAE